MGAGMHAERALLGALLVDPARQQPLVCLLSPEDFYRPWHGQVLAAMRRLAEREVSAGPQAVYAELEQDPDLPLSVSHDAVRLADLMQACPVATHAPAYAGLVIGSRIRRDLALEGGRVVQAASPPDAGLVDGDAVESARLAVTSARDVVAASRRRWMNLPADARRELPAPVRDEGTRAEIARRAGRVRDELGRLREDLWAQAGDRIAGRLAAISRELAGQLADQDATAANDVPCPGGAAAEAAGVAALRDVIAEPSSIGYAIGWWSPVISRPSPRRPCSARSPDAPGRECRSTP